MLLYSQHTEQPVVTKNYSAPNVSGTKVKKPQVRHCGSVNWYTYTYTNMNTNMNTYTNTYTYIYTYTCTYITWKNKTRRELSEQDPVAEENPERVGFLLW